MRGIKIIIPVKFDIDMCAVYIFVRGLGQNNKQLKSSAGPVIFQYYCTEQTAGAKFYLELCVHTMTRYGQKLPILNAKFYV